MVPNWWHGYYRAVMLLISLLHLYYSDKNCRSMGVLGGQEWIVRQAPNKVGSLLHNMRIVITLYSAILFY